MRFRLILIALVGVALLPATASAGPVAFCTRYASTSGSDANAGTLSSPYRSVQKLSDSLASGAIGCLRGGTYAHSGTLYFRNGGATIASYPREKATISGYSEVRATAVRVTLKNLRFTTTGLVHTMRIYGNNTIVEGSDITNNHKSGAGACISVGGSTVKALNVIIRLNKLHNCGSNADNLNHAIYANNFRDLTIKDNLIWLSGAYSIQLYPTGERATVSHNVIDGSIEYSIRGGIVIDGSVAVGHIVENNVIVNVRSGIPAVNAKTGSGHIARNNCFFNNRGGNVAGRIAQSGNVTADPKFVNRAARDYRLGGSACLAVVGYDTAAKVAANG